MASLSQNHTNCQKCAVFMMCQPSSYYLSPLFEMTHDPHSMALQIGVNNYVMLCMLISTLHHLLNSSVNSASQVGTLLSMVANLSSVAKENYCPGNPQDGVVHSVVVSETFERKLGSRVDLACKDFYTAVATGNKLEAVCTAISDETGVWVPTGHCACKGAPGII